MHDLDCRYCHQIAGSVGITRILGALQREISAPDKGHVAYGWSATTHVPYVPSSFEYGTMLR